MNKVLKILLLFTVTASIFGCANKDKVKKLPGKYIELMQEIEYAQPDKALATKTITIPNLQINDKWLNSNFSVSSIPENIKIEPELTYKINTLKLAHSSNFYDVSTTPVIFDNILYSFNNSGYVTAYNVSDLTKLIWSKKLLPKDIAKDSIGGGLVCDKDFLVITLGNTSLIALNKDDGSEIWNYNLSSIARSTPTIKDNKVFVLTVDNRLYCIDLHTGKLLWTHEGAIEQFGILGSASPVVNGNLVIVPHSSGQLNALNVKSGEVVWQLSLIKSTDNSTMLYLNDIDMTPIINQDILYVSNYAGTMFAVNVSTGQIKWTNDSIGGNKFAWIAGDYIYSVNKYNQLTAVLKQTGHVKWATDLVEKTTIKNKSNKDKVVISGPVMVNSMLYLTNSEGKLSVFNPISGAKLSEYSISKNVYSPPIAVGDKIYFINNSGILSIVR
jgi:outer membrane protein assembly factor BamB